LTIERLGEHKNRVLSAADHWQAVQAATGRSRVSEKSDASVVREESESRNADETVVWNDGARLGQGDIIKEVVARDRRDHGSDQAVDSKPESQNASGIDKELLHTIDVEHNDGWDEAGQRQNNMSGTHTTGNLDSSSNEVTY
jgi:alpha-1,4-galacturonosyltransferase